MDNFTNEHLQLIIDLIENSNFTRGETEGELYDMAIKELDTRAAKESSCP